jgi:hypothetical protein
VSEALSKAHSSKAAQSGRRCKRWWMLLTLREADGAEWVTAAVADAGSLSAPCAEGFRL